MLIDDTTSIYVGQTEITKVYAGTNVVYEKNTSPYTEVNYLESTGTQIINTGIDPSIMHGLQIDFQFTSNNGALIFGSRNTWQKQGFMICADNGIVGNQYYIQLSTKYSKASTTNNQRHLLTFNMNGDGSAYLDSSRIALLQRISFSAYAPIYLFGNFDGELQTEDHLAYGKVKIYSCKIYNGTVLLRDYIPVLDRQNVPCLYDKVSETFFYNNGTGTFLYG